MSRSLVAASSQYLEIDVAGLVTNEPLVISAWFQTTTVAAGNAGVVWVGDKDSADVWLRMHRTADAVGAGSRDAGNAETLSNQGVIATNTWVHGLARFVGDTERYVYKDGTSPGIHTVSRSPTGFDRISIGRAGDSTPGDYFDGLIGEVAIWTSDLTTGDIAALAAGGSPEAASVMPVRYWRFQDDGDLTCRISGSVLTNTGTTYSSTNPTVDEPPVGSPISACKGTFSANTSTGDQIVSFTPPGDSFTPKAVIVWGTFQTAVGFGAGCSAFYGAATSTTQRWCSTWVSEDGVTTTNTAKLMGSDCVIEIRNLAGTADAKADFVSFGNNQFTINWSDAPAAANIVHFLVLGGDAITNAKAGNFDTGSAAGQIAVTDPGFQPDFVMLHSNRAAIDTFSNGTSANFALGAADAFGDGAIAWASQDALTTTAVTTVMRGANQGGARRCIVIAGNSAGTVAKQASFTSFDATGFTLNWDSGTTGIGACYLALQGGEYRVGIASQPTSSYVIPTTSLGFRPAAVMFTTNGLLSDSALNATEARLMIGASDGVNQGGIWIEEDDGVTTTAGDQRTQTTYAIESNTQPSTSQAAATVNMSDYGFNVDWVTADATVRDVIYMAFGPGESPVPDPSASVIETFTGADTTTPPNSNWTNGWASTVGVKIASNAATSDNASFWGTAYWDTETFGPDVEVIFTVTTLPPDDHGLGFLVRGKEPSTGTTVDGYHIQWRRFTAASDTVSVYRMDNKTETLIGRRAILEMAVGDKFAVRAASSRFFVWVLPAGETKWLLLLDVSDSTYQFAGYVGVGIDQTGAIDDFAAMNYVGPYQVDAPEKLWVPQTNLRW